MKMGIGIVDLERLNKLPKTVASPEMDIEQLKRMDEYIRKQWWDEVRRIEGEYRSKYVPEGERNEYLEANISMAELKLVVSFLDNGERCPEHKFKEDEIGFLRSFEELAVIGILSVDELVDYFARIKGKERGFVKIAFDAVSKGYNVMDKIVNRSGIPGDLKKAFKRVYAERVEKMNETAKKYIDKYGPVPIVGDINYLLDESKKERDEVEHRISVDIERRLSEFDTAFSSLEEDKTRLERKVLELERELSLSSDALKQLEEERDAVRKEYENRINEHASILDGLKDELRKLEDAKEELQKATVRSEEEKRKVEEEQRKITGLSESVRNEVEELRSENVDLQRRKEEMDALIDSFREEDVFFDGITKEDARLREMDYVKRVEGRLKEMPIDGGKWRKVEVLDERGKIYDDLSGLKEGISYDVLNEIPNGLRIRAEKGLWRKGMFEVQILSHYRELFLNGFDRRKVSLKEVMPYIEELVRKKDYVLALASLTGWSAEAIEYIERRTQHPLILVDLNAEGNGRYFNRTNLDLKKFLYYV